jgi:hypothetical protein
MCDIASSTLPVALGFVHLDRQADAWALFTRNHRPVTFVKPPPRPRLGGEAPSRQEHCDTQRGDADEPNNWIFEVDHISVWPAASRQGLGCNLRARILNLRQVLRKTIRRALRFPIKSGLRRDAPILFSFLRPL